jgi:hypothetical protein
MAPPPFAAVENPSGSLGDGVAEDGRSDGLALGVTAGVGLPEIAGDDSDDIDGDTDGDGSVLTHPTSRSAPSTTLAMTTLTCRIVALRLS